MVQESLVSISEASNILGVSEAAFVSLAHSDEDIKTTIRIIAKALDQLKG